MCVQLCSLPCAYVNRTVRASLGHMTHMRANMQIYGHRNIKKVCIVGAREQISNGNGQTRKDV